MHTARITRSVQLPDPLRLARYLKAPESGPRVLFFSGGTALNPLSRELVRYTHNSIHLLTPFDSGGSSAKLREAFQMLAVGDLRSRLMALADLTVTGNPDILKLFGYRFPNEGDARFLRQSLDRLSSGRDPLVRQIPEPMRNIARDHLRIFQEHMPGDFDLRGASIGNLVLAAGYLTNRRRIDPVISLFSMLAKVRGLVRPIMNRYLHLAAQLESGEWIVGQHLLTGKQTPPITSRVKSVCVSQSRPLPDPLNIAIGQKIRELILQAEIICYPMGSFYSSLIANLLPQGVGLAVAENDCPKIYIPNTGADPEQFGMSLADSVRTLLRYLRKGCSAAQPTETLLNYVLLDANADVYRHFGDLPTDLAAIRRLGVKVVQVPLVRKNGGTMLDGKRVLEVLLSFA